MTSWYDRVADLLGEPGSDVVDLDPALAPEDVDLLLRAASDLLPPADAQTLGHRWVPDLGASVTAGDDDGSTSSWTSLVEHAQPWAQADGDDDLGAPLDLGGLAHLGDLGGFGDDVGLANAADDLADHGAADFPHADLDLEFGAGAGAYDDDDSDAPSWAGDDADGEEDDGGPGGLGVGLHQPDLPDGGELEYHLGEDDGFDDDAPVDDEDPDDGSSAWDDPPAHHHDF